MRCCHQCNVLIITHIIYHQHSNQITILITICNRRRHILSDRKCSGTSGPGNHCHRHVTVVIIVIITITIMIITITTTITSLIIITIMIMIMIIQGDPGAEDRTPPPALPSVLKVTLS